MGTSDQESGRHRKERELTVRSRDGVLPGRTAPARGDVPARRPSYGWRVLLPVNVTLGVVLVALLLVAAGVAAAAHLGRHREILIAGVRAAVQLAVVALAIHWVVGSVPLLLGFLALMYAVAVRTAGAA